MVWSLHMLCSPEPNLCVCLLDALLFNHQRLKNLDQTPRGDHDNLFRWFWQNKPLANGEFDWIFYPKDCVSLLCPRRNRFENVIVEHLAKWPNSFLQVCLLQFYSDVSIYLVKAKNFLRRSFSILNPTFTEHGTPQLIFFQPLALIQSLDFLSFSLQS
jgi:hypothetical protein